MSYLPPVLRTAQHRAQACPVYHASYGYASAGECLGDSYTIIVIDSDTGQQLPPISASTGDSPVLVAQNQSSSVYFNFWESGVLGQTDHVCLQVINNSVLTPGVLPYQVAQGAHYYIYYISQQAVPPNQCNCLTWGSQAGDCSCDGALQPNC